MELVTSDFTSLLVCCAALSLITAGSQSAGFSVLLTTDSFYPPKGGGDLSLRILARNLSMRGYEVAVSYFGKKEDPTTKSYLLDYSSPLRGFWPRHMIMRRALKEKLEATICGSKPDVVITQQIALSSTVDICRKLKVPVIVLLRGVDFLCLGSFWSGSERSCEYKCIGCRDVDHRLLQYPFFRREIFRIHNSLRDADVVISNSEYTKRTFMKILNLDSEVLNPPLERLPEDRRIRETGSILFVSPVMHKGVDVAIEVARRLNDERFVFVGNAKDSIIRKISRLDNVRHIHWADDMSELYSEAKLVIVPSIIPEGYGRVCAEAISRGIPCVVSAVGALPDVVADAGDIVHEFRDTDAWTSVVSRYSDAAYVRGKSEIALGCASKFITGKQYADSVESVIKNLLVRTQI